MNAAPLLPFPRNAAEEVESALGFDGHKHFGRFQAMRIGSRFQPILSVAHRRVVGHEALMRVSGPGGEAIAPLEAFRRARDLPQTVFLDRLGRAVHLRNFIAQDSNPGWLFLNVIPQVAVEGETYGKFFAELMRSSVLPPGRVVIEIMENAFSDHGRLAAAVEFYRDLGCLIAIDDFGAGHSNFDRIWRLRPDIVKLDRSITLQAAADPKIRRVIPCVVKLLHEAGSLALMEGIETPDEALIALTSEVDFVQGYLFGRPQASLVPGTAPNESLAAVWNAFRTGCAHESRGYRVELARYSDAIGTAASVLSSGLPMDRACSAFLQLPRAERCYLLDAKGMQVGGNVTVPRAKAQTFLSSLDDGGGAAWSHRQYFRDAMERPGRVQITRPYLSITGARNCVTFSLALRLRGDIHVICGDIDWGERNMPPGWSPGMG